MSTNIVEVFTTTLNNEVFVLPQGALTIDLNCTGASSGTFIGNSSRGGKSSTTVALATGVAYSFGNLGKPFPSLTINATGTIIEVTANY